MTTGACFVSLCCLLALAADCCALEYTAAVAQHVASYDLRAQTRAQAQAVMLANAAGYNRTAIAARRRGAQILVFPEYGLSAPAFATAEGALLYSVRVPDPAEGAVPCVDAEFAGTALERLSCIARELELVLVVDLVDAQRCGGGGGWGDDVGLCAFNTQVAFDERGVVVQKYHKYHLYGEQFFNRSARAEPRSFLTSFGVRFGMFVCFDILFEAPPAELVASGVRDFVFSSWWVNFPPILLSTQTQSGWARAHRVNLLAANTGNNGLRASGSGIYGYARDEDGGSGGADPGGSEVTAFPTSDAPDPALLVHRVWTPGPPQSAAPRLRWRHPGPQPASPSQQPQPPSPSTSSAVVPLPASCADSPRGCSVVASTGSLACKADVVIAEWVAAEALSLVAMTTQYHDLFPLELCALLPCPQGNASCVFGSPNVLESGTRLARLALRAEWLASKFALPFASVPGGDILPSCAVRVAAAEGALVRELGVDAAACGQDSLGFLVAALAGRPPR